MKNKIIFGRWSLLTTAILLLSSVQSTGQEPNQVIPSTPEGMALIRSINIPVNYSTGTAAINVPLYTVQSGGMQVPVALSYQASGIKVEDIATWVGLGWRLSAGGQITRMVRGKPDEGGFSMTGSPHGRPVQNLNNWDWAITTSRYNAGFDGEPDLFYFEIPGKSGMFVLDSEGKAHTIPYQPVQINWGKTYVSIIDEFGNKFLFQVTERINMLYTNDDDDDYEEKKGHITTWHLSEIISNRGESIVFEYEIGNFYSWDMVTYDNHLGLGKVGAAFNVNKRVTWTTNVTTTPQYLKSITWPGGKVEFVSTQGRNDVPAYRKLTEIKLYAPEDTHLKSYLFDYGQFQNGSLCLLRINEAANSQKELLCNFDYFRETNLPARKSWDMDHFGYYNGSGTGYYYPNASSGGFTTTGANKNPAWPFTKSNMLTSIMFKGGGKKIFEYEPNMYLGSGGTNLSWGGVRIKSIKEYTHWEDNTYRETAYTYLLHDTAGSQKTQSSGEVYNSYISYQGIEHPEDELDDENDPAVHLYDKNRNYIYDITGTSLLYKEVKETLPDGSFTIYKFTSFSDEACGDDPKMKYHTINSNGNTIQEVDANTFYPRTSYAYKRGLLTETNSFAGIGRKINRTVYHYNLNAPVKKNLQACILTRPINATSFHRRRHIVAYNWISQPVYLDSVVVEKGLYNLKATTSHTYHSTYANLTSTTNRDIEGNEFKTTYKYAYDYPGPVSSTDSMVRVMEIMRNKNMIGVPVETASYRNNQLVGAQLNTFKLVRHMDSIVLGDQSFVLPLQGPVTFNGSLSSISGGVFTKDPRFEVAVSGTRYDRHNNLTYTADNVGRGKGTIYGYNSSLPIASVDQAIVDEGVISTEREKRFVLSGYGETHGESFTLEKAQTVRGEGYFSFDSIPEDAVGFFSFNIGGSVVAAPSGSGSVQGIQREFSFEITLQPGTYTPVLSSGNTGGAAVSFSVTLGKSSYIRANQAFHTSFEDKEEGIEPSSGYAKTGRKVQVGPYQLKLSNFLTGTYELTYWKSTNGGINWQLAKSNVVVSGTTESIQVGVAGEWIDELRIMPPEARMTTQTYDPGVGVTSKTDVNGQTVYYKYDGFGRLLEVRDNDRNLVESYEYQ